MKTFADYFNHAEPLEIPYSNRQNSNSENDEINEAPLFTPESFLEIGKDFEVNGNLLIVALLIYIYRICGKDYFVIDFVDRLPNENSETTNEIDVSCKFPLVISLDTTQNFQNCAISVFSQLQHQKKLMLDESNNGKEEIKNVLENLQYNHTKFPFILKRVSSLASNKKHLNRDELRDLAVIVPDDGRLSFWRSFDKVLTKSSLTMMQEQFLVLLEDIAKFRNKSIADLEIIPQSEKNKLIEWNETHKDYDHSLCLQDIFESQATRTPDAIAARFEDQILTYSQLDEKSSKLANYLTSLGVGPNKLVGVFLERSLEMLISVLGILKAGGAYVPLDPNFPADRISYVLEDADAAALVTQDSLLRSVGEISATIVNLDADKVEIENQSAEIRQSNVSSYNLAYVIYTSGSTGKPKGVQIQHRAIVNFLFSMRRKPGLKKDDVLLAVTTLSFDIHTLEIFLPLITGASVIIAPQVTTTDGMALIEAISKYDVTVMQATPASFRLMLAADWIGCPDLKILCGGEPLPQDLARQLLPRCAELWNMYGPTETTVWSTITQVTDANDIHIGRPIDNTDVYIVDHALKLLPVGIIGELLIGGDGLANCYHNRPNLTDEKFIDHPFKPGKKIYRTGDHARFRADGNIDCLGRIDNQVKIRGYRIELGEIESLLEAQTEIRQAIVLAKEDEIGGKYLAAYMVLHNGQNLNTSDIRTYLKKNLPDYMVPSYFIIMDSLPLTPNGKVDRRSLPEPSTERPELAQSYVAPENFVELYLAKIWRDVLKLDRIGVNDKFFELGGTSIQAARVINTIQRDLDENIYIVSMFESPSIAEYADFLMRNYVEAITEKLGFERFSGIKHQNNIEHFPKLDRIDEEAVKRMYKSIVSLSSENSNESSRQKNRQALFILAPPRSGTTLLRIMLAGHPDIFAATELQLLGFHNLQERRRAYSGKFSLWLEGTIRALMEIKGCDVEEATRIMTDYEERGFSTKQFYHTLQSLIGDRLLADKSPSYVLDLKTLEKAERDFADPLYIHLVRHPYATIRSFVNYRMNQVLFIKPHPFSARQLAELVWLISHRNTLHFLEKVPGHRKYQLLYEDLVKTPEAIMKNLCDHFNLEYVPELVSPYQNIDIKMTDGIHADSKPMGDTNFFKFQEINPRAADSWKGVVNDDFLSDMTWRIAESFSYERADHFSGNVAKEPHSMRRQSVKTRKMNLQRNKNRRKQQSNINTSN